MKRDNVKSGILQSAEPCQNSNNKYFNSVKNYLKKFPNLWKLLISLKKTLTNISRLKDVIIMMFLLHIWPEQVYRFSTRKFLPSKKNRYFKDAKPIIPFELKQKDKNSIKKMKEIHVVGIGSSFNLNMLKKINGPVFLVSFWAPLHQDEGGNIIYSSDLGISKQIGKDHINKQVKLKECKEIKNENYKYVHARKEIIEFFKNKGHKILSIEPYGVDKDQNYFSFYKETKTNEYLNLFKDKQCDRVEVVEKVFKPPLLPPNPHWAQTGSFLPAICALSNFAEKVHVYGWDFFLDSSPEKMGYWKLFFKLYKYKLDTTYRAKSHFEEGLINFYFGYHLSQLPNIKIHGYLGQLGKHKKLIKKIERVLFN